MSDLAATVPLLRLALRRDRIMLPVWVYVLVAAVVGTAWSFRSLYPTAAQRRDFAAGVSASGATKAMYGPIHAPGTLGGLVAWRMLVIGGVLLSVCVVLLVIRHSRAEEEAGRVELIRAATVGRSAPLTAALATAATAVCAVAVVVAAGLVALGLPIGGATAFAAGWVGLGTVVAGIAAVAAQVSASARVSRGIALAALAVGYGLRAVADTGPTWLSWCSPLGWAQRVRPFAGDRWWVLLVPAAAGAALLVAAYTLQAHRDSGAGLLAPRPGPPRAGALLRTVDGLTIRLGRDVAIAWIGGVGVYGLALGGLAGSVDDLTNGSASTKDLLEKLGGTGALEDVFLGVALGIGALIVAAYGVTVLIRAADEEASGRLELVLAGRVGRLRWWTGRVVEALVVTAATMLTLGLTAGLVDGARRHDLSGQLGRVVGAALVQIPAIWLVVALAVLLAAIRRAAAVAGWAILGFCGLVTLIGSLVNAPQWVLDLSPFTHLPPTPGAAVPGVAVGVILGSTAIALVVAGRAFRSRDVG